MRVRQFNFQKLFSIDSWTPWVDRWIGPRAAHGIFASI